MPDILAHYAISYLVASRVAKPRYALLLALIGLLPDIDALLRIHRWVTHSLILTVTLTTIAAMPVFYINHKYIEYLVLASVLYTLHIVLDVFTAPTPLLWPLTNQAYKLNIELNGIIAEDGITIAPSITVYSEAIDFTQQQLVEGPIISAQGITIAVGAATILLIEWLTKTTKHRRR